MTRTYRVTNTHTDLAIVFISFAGVFDLVLWNDPAAFVPRWLERLAALLIALVSILFAVMTFSVELKLSDEAISYGHLFRRQTLRFDQIAFRREYEEERETSDGLTTAHFLEFVPSVSNAACIRISKDDFDLDTAFWSKVLEIREMRCKPGVD